ncbi:class III extradiol ring-cleavage dioxygenase [Pigmentibacter sp. JX0631]|uniref:DODA-type extradiol aromatic ring-opening family dioxygenase n=1 Tax=Pigmentibacter sp. JX0631 TaxID=2976982 RepID=UPI002468A3FE|nr:class III extradiol ring-cleavage dioxygenase [Pigmentibacter sp. JX0631]WGL59685.1 class III extradiol ring-cleavage dioxygenase [Pigmentibacter sp. JX0631]
MQNENTPCLFIAHGSPMNAIEKSDFSIKLNEIGNSLKNNISSIVCFSAHWRTEGLFISHSHKLKTIYDFSGFPSELSNVVYSPPGNPDLAERLKNELKDFAPILDEKRGIDHGAWSILIHLFPSADIPVVLISQNLDLKLNQHYEIGKILRPFRNEKILFIGSGNIVHSFFSFSQDISAPSPEWATSFDEKIKSALENKDHNTIIKYRRIFGKNAKLSVPTEEHFIPLLYIIGLESDTDQIEFLYEKFQNSSMSMRSFMLRQLAQRI